MAVMVNCSQTCKNLVLGELKVLLGPSDPSCRVAQE